MTPEQFCYWLQGYVETNPYRTAPTTQEWSVIVDHMALVFEKKTPNYGIAGWPGGVPICGSISGKEGAGEMKVNGGMTVQATDTVSGKRIDLLLETDPQPQHPNTRNRNSNIRPGKLC